MPRFRRPFRRRFKRRFTRTRPTVETQRWESAIFDVTNTIAVEPDPVITYFELMKIAEHLGDETTQQGLVMQNITRFVEIGGVVFDFHVAPLSTDDTDPMQFCKVHKSLVTLPVDNQGLPFLWDPFVTQQPIATVFSATQLQADEGQPTRIHWRESELIPITATDPPTQRFPFFQWSDRQRTHSLKLRRRIDDHQGLYFVIATDGAATANAVLTYWIHGTLYYRVRFS